ncbi:hypothetical protein [Caballeronia sp. DA-9]|uniref:hypothetical protein n=1 Tax=Caballeronia sp. DA-9 TaxID=3436237 RepID=UPI003F679508
MNDGRIATQTSLAQIDRLKQVDQLYTKMQQFFGACAIGAVLGASLYAVLAYAAGAL